MTADLSIYLITDPAQVARRDRTVIETVCAAVAGGVTTVQLRDKHAGAAELLELVGALAARLPARVTLLINDHVKAAAAARAAGLPVAGVHVGQGDAAVEDVRRRLGPDALIGLTASTPAQVAAATASPAGVSYLGLGAVHPTTTKPDAPAPIGAGGVAELAGRTHLPAVAVGGIGATDLPALRRGGLAGAAVVSWICDAPDPRAAAQQLAGAWRGAA